VGERLNRDPVTEADLLVRDVEFTLTENQPSVRSGVMSGLRDAARRKLVELDDEIRKVNIARVALQHVIRCRHQELAECPNFLHTVSAASRDDRSKTLTRTDRRVSPAGTTRGPNAVEHSCVTRP